VDTVGATPGETGSETALTRVAVDPARGARGLDDPQEAFMLRSPRPALPSPAMVVACLALGLALGGTSYAVVVKPGKNTVGSRELKRNAVIASKIKAASVDGAKVRDDALTGQDINEASLAPVPAAALADRATGADRAGVADNVAQIVYRTTTVTIGPAPAEGMSSESPPSVARCPDGHHVIGGGVKLEENMSQIDGYPSDGGTGWTARAGNDDIAAEHTFTVYAVCVASPAIG
jgi:hypothetical protein